MKKLSLFYVFVLISTLLHTPLHAHFIERMYKALGTSVNITKPGAFQDQAAGYYTGGGFVMRQKNQTYQPVNVTLPHIGMGCNGIDMFFGSLSFMKGEQLIQLMRNIGVQAPTYAFQLALKTMAPQIENLFAQLRKMALDVNALMTEDCLMVQQLFASALPKGSAFQQAACTDVMARGNTHGDWFGAKEACKKPEEVSRQVTALTQQHKDLLIGEHNLVWHALSKIPAFKEDQGFKQFVMTLTGTVIVRKEGKGYKTVFIEGRADDKEHVAAYLKGGVVEGLLHCRDTEHCLHPTFQKETIQEDQAMQHRVRQQVQTIRTKYLTGTTPLTSEEQVFLNDTVKLPVYQYIQVSAAVGTDFLMQDALEYIGISLLLVQFEKAFTAVLEAIDNLQHAQMEDTLIQEFKQNLLRTKERVQQFNAMISSGAVHRLTHMMRTYEQGLIAQEI